MLTALSQVRNVKYVAYSELHAACMFQRFDLNSFMIGVD